ncbi:MAG: hypothetical protein NTV34_02265, partial [Proteobacteria bacterium]|nr:hypothetical protein [Pseudomonadota bacterium]
MKVTANIPEYSGGPQTVAVELPSDKSISHRVIFFGAMAQGMSTIHRVSSSQDCLATKTAMESFGVRFSAINEQRNFASEADYQSFTVQSPGVFAWRSPSEAIDAGNSGTTARLLFGIASGVPGLLVMIIEDESLSARPMGRVVAPLTACGAEIRLDGERLPAFITGKSLRGFNVRSDVVSAQVKSALLLASICATGESVINVAAGTRNHTEQMLRFLGAPLGQMDQESSSDGRDVFHVRGPWQVPPLECTVPGDPSAMAFFAALAFLHP